MITAAELPLETITVEQHGRVLTARYACPPFNFVTMAFIRDLDKLTEAVDDDDSVGSVVLTGGVEGRFLTHADPAQTGDLMDPRMPALSMRALRPMLRLSRRLLNAPGALKLVERADLKGAEGLIWVYRWRRTILRMNRSSTVYIAAINGPATGGGHEIALACDLRFVSDAPHIRLGQIESLAGLIPGGGGSQRIPRMIGTAKALELMLEGAPLTAQQELELGLINAIIPDAELVTHAQQTATRLARRAPVAVQAMKRLTYFTTSEPLDTALDSELAGFMAAGLQPAIKPTLAAFIADMTEFNDSPLSIGAPAWLDGTRVDQTP